MKIFFTALLFFSLWNNNVFGDEKEFYSPNTRKHTLKEAFSLKSADSLILLRSFEGLSVPNIREAYQLTDAKVDSIILSEERAGHFFSKYSLFAVHIYKDARQSPQKAMSFLFPIFTILFLLYLLVFGVKTFLIRPQIGEKIKPDAE